ncbi:MAG: hypothetical protein ACK4GQ_05400, partial [Candidatus Hadarchaeales archaeon]
MFRWSRGAICEKFSAIILSFLFLFGSAVFPASSVENGVPLDNGGATQGTFDTTTHGLVQASENFIIENSTSPSCGEADPPQLQGYALVIADDFQSLDLAKWIVEGTAMVDAGILKVNGSVLSTLKFKPPYELEIIATRVHNPIGQWAAIGTTAMDTVVRWENLEGFALNAQHNYGHVGAWPYEAPHFPWSQWVWHSYK